MCGIAGIVQPPGKPVAEDTLWALAGAMSHRGPDASGVWRSCGVGLAHTRLSLFDLSDAADQPFTDGVDALVFNGEIYNFVALRGELEAAGRRFTTTSDTEVLFAALQELGVAGALERVQGMFAFAFHHAASATTHLARDRYGIKPLLYASAGDRLVFASEAKALRTAVPVAVDETMALLSLRALGDKFQTRTLFRGVRQVAPGWVLSVRDGHVVDEQRFDRLLDHVDPARYREIEAAGFDRACDELERLLSASVDAMAACDARLGIFLSGGIDSGLLATLAARGDRPDLRAFTSDVKGARSERRHAEALAASLGIPLDVSPFEPDHWTADWVQATWHLETPVITNPSAVPFARLAALAHTEGYQAMLTGEGADELFLGYPRLASAGLERVAGAPVAALRRLYRQVPGLVDVVLNERDANSNDFLRGVAGGFEEDALAAEAHDAYGFLDPDDATLHALSAVMVQASLQALLQRNDRMGMSASIESRFPFLDEEVVAFALNLPASFKLRRSPRVHDPKHPFVVDKAPVREVAVRHLGPAAGRRRKSGFPTPGLHAVRVRPGTFEGSWMGEAVGGGQGFDRQITDWHQPYDIAKLLSIEIFGRLFDAGQSVGEVEAFVRHAVIAPT